MGRSEPRREPSFGLAGRFRAHQLLSDRELTRPFFRECFLPLSRKDPKPTLARCKRTTKLSRNALGSDAKQYGPEGCTSAAAGLLLRRRRRRFSAASSPIDRNHAARGGWFNSDRARRCRTTVSASSHIVGSAVVPRADACPRSSAQRARRPRACRHSAGTRPTRRALRRRRHSPPSADARVCRRARARTSAVARLAACVANALLRAAWFAGAASSA